MSIKNNKNSLFSVVALAIGALGVVYGDIGTSPLYAIREMFFGHGNAILSEIHILSKISLVIWTLVLVIAIKYVTFVLRADNEGSGGVFALYGLLQNVNKKVYKTVGIILMFAAGLLFGDGVITPAISVLSAVEGLSVVANSLTPYVVPITIIILICLFSIQMYGTAKIGSIFGPVMIVWFTSLGLIALPYIYSYPEILKAINPYYLVKFFEINDIFTIFKVLGSVVLVITGGEALYADMGHFGKKPIRFSWFGLVFPSLILNYLGQGAYLLSGKQLVDGNLFYSLIPNNLIIPAVILATLATIIASQALISGVFSLVMQAVSLGLMPYQDYRQTHEEHEGQIYVPLANWFLLLGSILFVVSFKTSASLASAYGLAESGVMFVTTLGMILVSRKYWSWSKTKALLVFIPFLIIDTIFLVSNSLKFFEGGYIPVLISTFFAIIFMTWLWGRKYVRHAYLSYPGTPLKKIIRMKEKNGSIPKTVVFLTTTSCESWTKISPVIEQLFIDRYKRLPKHIILLKVTRIKHPFARKERYKIYNLYENNIHGSITGVDVRFGFMEEPNVEKVLRGIAKHNEVPISANNKDWLIHILQPKLHLSKNASIFSKLRFSLFVFLHRISYTPMDYFHLGDDEPLSVDYVPVYLG